MCCSTRTHRCAAPAAGRPGRALLCNVEATAAERHPWQLDPLAWARLDTVHLISARPGHPYPGFYGPAARGILSAPALLEGRLRAGGAYPRYTQQQLAGAEQSALRHKRPGLWPSPHYGGVEQAGGRGSYGSAYAGGQRGGIPSGFRSSIDVRERMTDRDPDTGQRFPTVHRPP